MNIKSTKFKLIILITTLSTILVVKQHCTAQQVQGNFYCGTHNNIPATIYQNSRDQFPVLTWVESLPGYSSGYSALERCQIVSQKFESNRKTNNLNYIIPGYVSYRRQDNSLGRQPVLCTSSVIGNEIINCPRERVLLTLSYNNYNQIISTLFPKLEYLDSKINSKNNILQTRSDKYLVINIRNLLNYFQSLSSQQYANCQRSAVTGVCVSTNISSTSQETQEKPLDDKRLCTLAKLLTVKVLVEDFWGSGVIIQKQGTNYYVLTNNHVLYDKKEVYTIEVFDGVKYRKYQANVIKRFTDKQTGNNDLDLAILQFNSPSISYKTTPVSEWKQGQRVLAAGFPTRAKPSESQGSLFCTPLGDVSFPLERPMQRGYQLGYNLELRNGMSGGSLFNEQGQLIGINGKSRPTLFVNSDLYLYRDGSRVNAPLDKLAASSWAIPIETVINHNQLQFLGLSLDANNTNNPTIVVESAKPSGSSPYSLHKLQSLAEQYTVMVNKPNQLDDIGFSGSGVIIAKQPGGTYYVVTSLDAIPPSPHYEVRTYDQNNYPLTLIRKHPDLNLVLFRFSSSVDYKVPFFTYSYDIENLVNKPGLYLARWVNAAGKFQLQLSLGKLLPTNSQNKLQFLNPSNKNILNSGIVIDQQGQLVGINSSTRTWIPITDILKVISPQ